MKYYIISGEASGDLHGANLIKAIKRKDPQAEIRAWGGDLMQAAGATLVKHYRDLAFMGFVEVLRNLRTIFSNIDFCKKDILAFQPDVLILIDYPGFNLRIAEWAKKNAVRVFYYISPQIWAWHTSRVHKIKRDVERMFVILPFEPEFYARYQYPVDFVGHPLLDVIANRPLNPEFLSKNGLSGKPLVALLPGSRRQEIAKMLPVMLSVVPMFPDCQFAIAGAPSIPDSYYRQWIDALPPSATVRLIPNQTYDLLQHAKAALVTSGTATLETALFGVPEVVCYKGNPLSYFIARRLVSVKYISLVNLIADRPIVRELIQNELNTQNLQQELEKLLDPDQVAPILEGYAYLREQLGHAGASERTAQKIVGYLRDS